jgi:ubiquitin-protein ligase
MVRSKLSQPNFISDREIGDLGPYNPGLDDPVLKPTIVQTLRSIEFLLTETRKYEDKYDIKEDGAATARASRGLTIFKSTFDKFIENSRRNQKQKSILTVSKWAIFDADHFDTKVSRLRGFIDGLESVTRSLGLFEQQQNLMREEIRSITDVEKLELLSETSSIRDVSDTASQRLLFLDRVHGEPPEQGMTRPTAEETIQSNSSYYTAQSQLEPQLETDLFHLSIQEEADEIDDSMPSNRRIMASLNSISKHPQPTFDSTATLSHGQLLAGIKRRDRARVELAAPIVEHRWKVLEAAKESGHNRLRRVAREVKKVYEFAAWASVAPIDNDMTKLLASIEGPPGTPYEHGIFWLSYEYPQNYPFVPPKVRFITRIYHPNVDSRGEICLDTLKEAWTPVNEVVTVLTSILTLLTDPGLDDPLVVEIAQTFIENHHLYCENARLYTLKYATGERPDTSSFATSIPDTELMGSFG